MGEKGRTNNHSIIIEQTKYIFVIALGFNISSEIIVYMGLFTLSRKSEFINNLRKD